MPLCRIVRLYDFMRDVLSMLVGTMDRGGTCIPSVLVFIIRSLFLDMTAYIHSSVNMYVGLFSLISLISSSIAILAQGKSPRGWQRHHGSLRRLFQCVYE